MLLFRSEEHIQNWCARWHQPPGGRLTLPQVWGLAKSWYSDDRRQPHWRRKSKEESQTVLTDLGLTGDFWQL